MSYAGLLRAVNSLDNEIGAFVQNMSETLTIVMFVLIWK